MARSGQSAVLESELGTEREIRWVEDVWAKSIQKNVGFKGCRVSISLTSTSGSDKFVADKFLTIPT